MNPRPPRLPFHLVLPVIALLAFATSAVHADDAALLAALREPGHVLLLRHANAPGIGDPANFRIGDCATQRNLDQRGRAQARAIGERLRAGGIDRASVFSSEWCRCMETAALLALGAVEAAPALNSFFGRPDDGPARLAAARTLIAQAVRRTGPVVMVMHQVTIAGLTGENVGAGVGAVVRADGGQLRFVGTLALLKSAGRAAHSRYRA